jgi:hypothetical protein
VIAGSGGGIFVLGIFVTATPTPADAFLSGDFAIAKLRDAPSSGGGGGGGGGGGCATVQAARGGTIDPTLPLLLMLSLLWARLPNIRRQFPRVGLRCRVNPPIFRSLSGFQPVSIGPPWGVR